MGKRGGRAVLLPLLSLALTALLLIFSRPAIAGKSAAPTASATILLYHRFDAATKNEMTIRPSEFDAQIKFLRDNGYTIVPLRDIVNFMMGRGTLPPRAVAITSDDGHRSVFTEMKPIVERYRIPVTLFIYPSAISNASYAMTWEQLKELRATGLFTIESHTYWHPNFNKDKRRLSPAEYQKFVDTQLTHSKEVLERRMGAHVDLLAWPFGIYNDQLIAAARKSGYVAAFTIARRAVSRQDNIMAIPRCIVTDKDVGKAFESLLTRKTAAKGSSGNRPHH
jgi:peptidoglycan/xylan/chitin deacetylase (PgdA/CDA1 family)